MRFKETRKRGKLINSASLADVSQSNVHEIYSILTFMTYDLSYFSFFK